MLAGHAETALTTPARDRTPRFRSEISREEINRLPIARYDGPVRMITSADGARAAIRELKREKVLGFDTETRAAFRKGESYPPALVQLAGEGAVWLFRLNRLAGLGGLARILSQPGVVKAGVALERDIKELREVRRFKPAGFVELEKLSDYRGIAANGLRGLAAIVLGVRISKGAQRSNWARARLSEKMIQYAATDAWACREIYLRLAPEHG
jgi:ribonuclease D